MDEALLWWDGHEQLTKQSKGNPLDSAKGSDYEKTVFFSQARKELHQRGALSASWVRIPATESCAVPHPGWLNEGLPWSKWPKGEWDFKMASSGDSAVSLMTQFLSLHSGLLGVTSLLH